MFVQGLVHKGSEVSDEGSEDEGTGDVLQVFKYFLSSDSSFYKF